MINLIKLDEACEICDNRDMDEIIDGPSRQIVVCGDCLKNGAYEAGRLGISLGEFLENAAIANELTL